MFKNLADQAAVFKVIAHQRLRIFTIQTLDFFSAVVRGFDQFATTQQLTRHKFQDCSARTAKSRL